MEASPKADYHPMSVVVDQPSPHATALTKDAAAPENKYHCRFDPMLKNGRSLVLRFDSNGEATFEEMSRLEVLRMTEQAAMVVVPEVSGGSVVGTPKALQMAMPAPQMCDVQRVHARDIRKLDNAFSVSNEPAITIRKQAILFNADPIRAIIMRDACLMFVPDGADSLLLMLKENFREMAHRDHDDAHGPYEFQALEALLATLSRYFEADYEKTAPVISSTLDRLANGRVSAGELETLRVFKNTIDEFESQVDALRRVLMELLDNEEDLHLLYLTKLHHQPQLLNDLFSFDSEEAEVLIENYLQDIFSTRTKAALMQHRIQNTESLVMLKLDSMRNYLLGVDLIFSIVAIALGMGTYVTGAFGMNLNSHVQEENGWFWPVLYVTTSLIVVLCFVGIQYFKRMGVFL
ncbi:TPA: hypothetical protein N0F65_002576 [Lagenidium giganteum]|uniref:Magnesium transporter n=1 Tax=Lagenidium giganteum TaxID=4803 RepID=A0AAV2YWZ4_9STRA|nr:TPA: hypothetical protein N0F65_002576 [Lagenidium giganteum]